MKYVERGETVGTYKTFNADNLYKNKIALVQFFGAGAEKVSQSNFEVSDWILEDEDVRFGLASFFNHRCAFCESPIDSHALGRTHRFRPKSEASPVQHTGTAHLYYLWLADAWQNLYYICGDCQPEDALYFPVISDQRAAIPTPSQLDDYQKQANLDWPFYPIDERPVLVDPCEDQELWLHFQVFTNGEISGRDRRGRVTIQHFSLNRQSLIEQRRTAFAAAISYAVDMLTKMPDADTDPIFAFETMPFGGSWRILFRNLLAKALKMRASDDIEGRFKKLVALPDAYKRFHSAEVALSAPKALTTKRAAPSKTTFSKPPTSVHIQNFKSLENLSFKLPAPGKDEASSLLILGENAVGKSSILEAVAMALMGEGRRRKLELTAPEMVLNPKYMGAERLKAPKEGMVKLSYGRHTQTLSLSRSARGKSAGFKLEGGENELPIFAYGAFRHYMNAEKRYTQDKYVRSLFDPAHIISNPEKWLLRLSDDDFAMVARSLRAVFSVEVEFEVLERDHKAKKVYVVAALDSEIGPKQRTPLGIVSSGFRAVLAVLCNIMQGLMDKRINRHFESLGSARGLVLIDEVEAHLHPRWKMSIMTGLRRALPHVTFIATSHDPLCLRGMKKDEVMVLERVAGTQSGLALPVFTQSIVDLPDHEFWTIEQLLTADFFQLRSTATAREKTMQEVERKLANGERDAPQVKAFLKEISDTLPIGDTHVHRLVQDAIAEYLTARRNTTEKSRKALTDSTKRLPACAGRIADMIF